MQLISTLGLSVLLSACLLSDFDRAERAENARHPSRPEPTRIDGSAGRPPSDGDNGDREDGAGGAAGRGAAGMMAATRAGSGASTAGRSAAGADDAGANAPDKGAAGMLAASAGAAAESGGAGTGGAGASGAAGDGAPSCGDTASDPRHCGSCNNDCSTPGASVSCVKSQCVSACQTGFGDCNGDLALGARGDGCETQFSQAVSACGMGNCNALSCGVQSQLEVGTANAAGTFHGDPYPGAAFMQLCGGNTVLVGLDFAADEWCMSSVAPRCAAVTFEGAPGSFTLTTGESQGLQPLSSEASKRLECPRGAVVTAVSGGIWHDADNAGPCVRQLALTCSQLVITAPFQFAFMPGSVLREGAELESQQMFMDTCPDGQVVVGFKGQFDGYVDGISTLCASLTTSRDFGPSSRTP